MSDSNLQRATALPWLRPEIDRSIDAARHSLASVLTQEPGRDVRLLDACSSVHQAHGALEMLGLQGAARFCRALEEALVALRTDTGKLTEINASAVDRAMFALKQYLADVAQGEPDMPLKLFPVYQELNALCARRTVSESELFYPDITALPPLDARTPRIHPSTLAAHVGACCALFQRGLLAWLKGETRFEGIGMMRSALDGLQRAAGGLAVHPALWWTAAGLLDLLAHAGERIDTKAAGATLGRLERALRALNSGSEVDSAALMREILYPLALAPSVTDRVREIKALYGLDRHIPEFCVSGTLEHDTGALAPALDAMRSTLEGIEQSWSQYAAGTPHSLPRLRDQLDVFKNSARDLGHYRLVRLLDIVLMLVARLPQAAAPEHEGLSLEMASAFLFMEGMLDHFTDPPSDIDQQVAVMAGSLLDALKPNASSRTMPGTARDDITQRERYADVRSQVIGEVLDNLRQVEALVDEAAREPDAATRLESAGRPLAQAAGALKMLGLNRASGVLAACLQLLRSYASDHGTWKLGALQWAADGLSCLGFYLDGLRRGGTRNDELLADFVRRMANERELPAGSTGWIPASVGLIEADLPEGEAALHEKPAPARMPQTSVTTVSDGEIHLPPRAPQAAAVPASEAVANTTRPQQPAANDLAESRAPAASPAVAHRDAAELSPAGADDVPDPSLLPVFLDEARALIGRLYDEFTAWRGSPRDIRAARAFARTLHTLKGSARLVGAMRLGDLTHAVESDVGAAIERNGDAFDFTVLQQKLTTIAEYIGALAASVDRRRGAPDSARAALAPPGMPDLLDAPASVRVPITALNGLVDHAGELSEVRARTEDEMGSLRRSLHELAETVARLSAQVRELDRECERPTSASDAGPGARVETAPAATVNESRTRLQELSRALAESVHDVETLQQGLVVNCADTEAALALQGRLDRNLRHKLLELRSLPFGSLTERMRRTVRQTAAQLAREAELGIDGESVAIDRAVLQRLAAPLEHMLRNAVAHGIEPVPVRIATGKSPVGGIRLTMEQSEDENVLTLTDDGAGLDLEQIHLQAIHLGLVAAGEAVTERMLCGLIFAPGLSTASTVTPASGRGVGLDVVRAEVRALGGSIEVSFERGAGTCFRIRFPTSLSYTQAVLVRSTQRLCAIPATLVEQMCELPADALQGARDKGRMVWNGRDHRFVELSQLLGEQVPPPAARRSNSVLLLQGDGERTALAVDQVLRKQAIELKSIGPQLARVRGIAGATIIGKGEVVLILDPDELIMHAAPRSARESRPAQSPGQAAPRIVLVVDDSLTMRRMTARLLARAGYRVLVARDGVDALQQIEETVPDLVIADIEMPNMDGFELASHLRSDPRTEETPIVVVTSLLADKHQRLAVDLGVDMYFGKPYAEERLLAEVAALLQRRSERHTAS